MTHDRGKRLNIFLPQQEEKTGAQGTYLHSKRGRNFWIFGAKRLGEVYDTEAFDRNFTRIWRLCVTFWGGVIRGAVTVFL